MESGLMVGQQNAAIADTMHLRDVAIHFGVAHIGATYQIRLNRPCAVAMRPCVKLL